MRAFRSREVPGVEGLQVVRFDPSLASRLPAWVGRPDRLEGAEPATATRPAPVTRLRHLLNVLDRNPEWKERVARTLRLPSSIDADQVWRQDNYTVNNTLFRISQTDDGLANHVVYEATGLTPGDQQRLGLPHAAVAELPKAMQRLLVRRWFHCLMPPAEAAEKVARQMVQHIAQR